MKFNKHKPAHNFNPLARKSKKAHTKKKVLGFGLATAVVAAVAGAFVKPRDPS